MACPGTGFESGGGLAGLSLFFQLLPLGREQDVTVLGALLMNLARVEVVKNDFPITLATENVESIVNAGTGMAISAGWNLTLLDAFVPLQLILDAATADIVAHGLVVQWRTGLLVRGLL